MAKKPIKKQDIRKLMEIYEQYKATDLSSKKNMPQLTLDQQIESINPYYIRSETIKYG